MRSKFALIVIGLLVAAGTSLAACSSGEPVQDEQVTEAPPYQPAEGAEYQEYDDTPAPPADGERAEQPTADDQQMAQPPMPGQTPEGHQEHQAEQMPEATGPVATVDGETIEAEEFNDEVDQLTEQMPHVPPAQVAQMQGEIVNQLIQKRLIDNAIEEADITVTDEEIEVRLQEIRREFEESPQAQFGDFDDFVAQMGMTAEELDEVVRETVAIEKLLEQRGADMPTEEDARQFYEENQQMFTEPEHVEARQLAIPVTTPDDEAWQEAEQRANEAHRLITEEGASFEEAAEQVEGAQADDNAAIPREMPQQHPQQPPAELPQQLVDTAFEQLEDGEVSEPIRIDQGWVIIERIAHQPEGVVDFEEVKDQLVAQLRNQAMEESLQQFLTDLEQEAEVERHPENIS